MTDTARASALYAAKDCAIQSGRDVFGLMDAMRQLKFSTRVRFFQLLNAAREKASTGETVAWPDALMYMSPVTFGVAALEALDWEERNGERQMDGACSTEFRKQFIDSLGTPLYGGRLYLGEGAAFLDSQCTLPCTEPLILDANGNAACYTHRHPAYILKLEDEKGRLMEIMDQYDRVVVRCAAGKI